MLVPLNNMAPPWGLSTLRAPKELFPKLRNNSPGHRPSAWQTTSPFILPVVLLLNSTAREAPLGPRSQKSATGDPFCGPWRPKARFFRFCGPSGRRPTMMIFWHRTKIKNQMISRSWEAHVAILDPKT